MSKTDKEVLSHPSFGMLGFYRTHSSGGVPLFGSSIQHKETIQLVLKTGEVERHLNRDWYYGGKTLYEVEMSGEQFANLLTNMNCGDGVPVTIRRTEKLGMLDYFDVPFEDKADVHKREFEEHCDNTMEDAKNLLKIISEKFDSKKNLLKSDKEEIKRLLWKLQMEIGSNMKYQLDAFNEQMEQSKTEAKAEIEMFWQNKMMNFAKEFIQGNSDNILKDIDDCQLNQLIELK